MTPVDDEDAPWKAILDEQIGQQSQHSPKSRELWLWLAAPVAFGLCFHGLFAIFFLFLGGISARIIARLPGTNRVRANAARFQTGCFLTLFVASCLNL